MSTAPRPVRPLPTPLPIPSDDEALDVLVARVAARVAPLWPLDSFIAVNPLWGRIDRPVEEVDARVAALGGARLTMDRSWYRQKWEAGAFTRAHIDAAVARARAGVRLDAQRVVDALQQSDTPLPVREKVTDVLDAGRDLAHEMPWSEAVVRQISRHCAAWFDRHQARVRLAGPDGLFASWRFHLMRDRRVALMMGLSGVREAAGRLPDDARTTIAWALQVLDVAREDREDYLDSLFFDVRGWAGLCAHRHFVAQQQGREETVLTELLAIRIAWEAVLLQQTGADSAWADARSRWAAVDAQTRTARSIDWILQHAFELATHAPLVAALADAPGIAPAERPDVQAVFCIDVRSEPFRRALETQSDGIATRGFAGFFGLPAAYHGVGDLLGRPQLPGPLTPTVRIADTFESVDGDGLAARRGTKTGLRKWGKQFATSAVSGFSFVESLGLFFGPRLVSDALGWTRPAAHPDHVGLSPRERTARMPRLVGAADGSPLETAQRVALAAGILRGLSLTRGHARLVALVGHGAQTVNNPHAAGYDCGACCGHAGDANARAVAALLNEPLVREGLRNEDIDIPEDTWFVAGVHDTTTDDVTLLDRHAVPASHTADLAALDQALAEAGEAARRRRAPSLGLGALPDAKVTPAIRSRARDWACVRPEWGLARNHSILFAPRARSRHLDLDGRSFLHHYTWQEDADFTVLEQLLTAPMVVSHWINFQYYASTVDNRVFGSGDKVLHNVVGGHLGVFEGNGGDLRSGLPLQSLHDGSDWVHEPVRLAVFVQAPRDAIARVIERHDTVRNLVDGGWVHLLQMGDSPGPLHAWEGGAWSPI
jgi:uncharacterized protein YbcC (UPF0753/DUF2309 family)